MQPPLPVTLVPHDVLHPLRRSAGGVLWRRAAGELQVALVHDRRRRRWTFPKGRLHGDEPAGTGAEREVTEETGYRVQRELLLGTLVRQSRGGRSKLTAYWLMRPLGGRFRPSAEVDDLAWTDLDDAAEMLAGRAESVLLDMVAEALEERRAAAG